MLLFGLQLFLAVGFSMPIASGDRSDLSTLFQLPHSSLEILAGNDANLTLGDVLNEYSRVTGLNLSITERTAELIDSTSVGLRGDLVVPAEEVHTVVQGLLHQHGFAVAALHVEGPRVLWIYSPKIDHDLRPRYFSLNQNDEDQFAEYPALLVSVPFTLNSLDARSVPSSLRPMIVSRPSSVIALGPSQIILSGRAADIAEWLDALRSADRTMGGQLVGNAKQVSLSFPASAIESVDRVLKVLDTMGSSLGSSLGSGTGSIVVREISASPRDSWGKVSLDLAILAEDELQATQRFYTLLALLRSKSWCEELVDSGTRTLPDANGLSTTLTLYVSSPVRSNQISDRDIEPAAIMRSLAVHSDFRIERLDIQHKTRELENGVVEHSLFFEPPHSPVLSRSRVLEFLKAIERDVPGATISELKLQPRTRQTKDTAIANDVAFKAKLVWREQE